MSQKDLKYYQELSYPIHIEKINGEDEQPYMAWCNELGKYACYGRGETEAEAVSNFIEDKSSFIEYLFNSGETIQEPGKSESESYSGFFNVRTSPVIHAKLALQAREMDISLNLYLNQLLSGAVEKRQYDNQIMNKLGELCGKLEQHHYEVTRQLSYQAESISTRFKWKAEYSNEYLVVA
jgi:hypothetical protein